LAVTTLVHAPARASATEVLVPTTTVADGESTLGALTPTDVTDSRLARLVAIRQERLQQQAELAARELRQEQRERRERREAREERRERRQDARAAARAAARAPQWVMPVPGAGWSASYGESGSSWSSGYHTGQDFTAPSGTPVLAVSDGTITSATWSDAYGNIIEITHPNGDQSWYAHMSGFERTSGSVSAGDVIGYVGCTGNCSGDHLHFEYHPGGGDAADPIAWLNRNGA
jgi:murein DD-endopeptidase MepM/ murein hydrolase activator NlpD